MKIGINIVEGFKKYQMNEHLSEHPCFWIFDENAKKYYFFPLTSEKEFTFNENILCFRDGDYERKRVFAQNVLVKGKVHYKYSMNMICACAVVDEKYVSTNQKVNFDAAIVINQKYKCSNFFELKNRCLELIYDYSYQIECYDGNAEQGFIFPNKKNEDNELPQEVFEFVMDIVDPAE